MQPIKYDTFLKLASNSIASVPLEKHNRNLMTWPNWNGVLEKQENDTAIESNREGDKCRETDFSRRNEVQCSRLCNR